MNSAPRIERVRHELKRRRLTVQRVERWAPQMVRVVLGGEELRGFTSLGFDDHIKLFFGEAMRDFTPRHFDADAGELSIDFYLHDAGPATTWAAQAEAGQALEVGGPKGSAVVALEGIDTHVFIGDETAVPAIGRRLEELPAQTRAIVFIEHDADAKWPAVVSRASSTVTAVQRRSPESAPAQELIEALREVTLPAGECFVWVAVESRAARAIRNYFLKERGFDKRWIKAAGYWQRGAAGSHDKIADDE